MNWPFFRLNEEHFTFHLQYKHSGTFANRKYEELSYPPKSENARPHSSNSLKNATPSSGTSPLAYYKEETPTPPPSPTRATMLRRLSTHEYLYILYFCMHNEKDE